MGFSFGSSGIELIPSEIPLLFWIDQNVNNIENNNFKKMIEKNINITILVLNLH